MTNEGHLAQMLQSESKIFGHFRFDEFQLNSVDSVSSSAGKYDNHHTSGHACCANTVGGINMRNRLVYSLAVS